MLHLADAGTNADASPQLLLQVGRGRQVVGVGVGFQQPAHVQAMFAHEGDDLVGGGSRGAAGLRIVIKD